MIVKFVSVWDDEIENVTNASLDLTTGEVYSDELTEAPENVEKLTDEYIIINEDEPNEKIFHICPECHSHVIGFLDMWDDEVTGDYIEHRGCPSCNETSLVQDWIDME